MRSHPHASSSARPPVLSRRTCLAALAGWAGILAGCGGGGPGGGLAAGDLDGAGSPGGPSAPGAWQTAWLAAVQPHQASAPGLPVPPPLVLENQTLRHVVRLTQAGDALRLRLSNAYGREPLVLAGVHVARATSGLQIDPETDVALRFGGSESVRVPAGGEAWSDELALALQGRERVAISLHVRERTAVSTWHAGAFQTGGIAPGDALAAAVLPAGEPTGSLHWLQAVEVRATRAGGVVVTLGDSITEGEARRHKCEPPSAISE